MTGLPDNLTETPHLHERARGGLNQREAYDIEMRIGRLEQRLQFAMNDRYGRYGDRW